MTDHRDLSGVDEDIRRRFESAWQSGAAPEIDDFIPSTAGRGRLATLYELVMIDLEFRWQQFRRSSCAEHQRGEPPLIEDYLTRFPELEQEYSTAELIREELAARTDLGDVPTCEEFQRRFPNVDFGTDDWHRWFPVQSPSDPKSGETLGEYRLIREIGRGGMGVVYEAEQLALGRRVALKVLPPAAMANAELVARFEREARAAAGLHHTSIVPVFGVGAADGRHFYAMQFIEGVTLDAVIRELQQTRGKSSPDPSVGGAANPGRGREEISGAAAAYGAAVSGTVQRMQNGHLAQTVITRKPDGDTLISERHDGDRDSDIFRRPDTPKAHDPPQVSSVVSAGNRDASIVGKRDIRRAIAELGVQVADALEYAHQRGVLHRDIKPANLILDENGVVWITDFGLARIETEDNLTRTGDVMGTLRYMPPEVLDGRSDSRSDIFSLGLTLYELFSCRAGYDEADRHRLLKRITEADIRPLRECDPTIPADVETIIRKCLDRDPTGRYQTAGALRDDLERFLNDEPIRARRATAIERLVRWSRRNTGLAVSLSAVLLLLLSAAVGSGLAARRFNQLAQDKQELADERETQRLAAVTARGVAEDKTREAESQELAAYDARDEARRRQRQARDAEAQARRLAEDNRRQLYTSQMLVAADALEIGTGIGRVRQILDNWIPKAGQSDLRGWEWYYLLGRCHEEVAALPDDVAKTRCLCWKTTGERLLVAHDDAMLTEFEADLKTVAAQHRAVGGASAVVWNSDQSRVAVAGFDGRLRILSWPQGQILVESQLPAVCERLAWSFDDAWIACSMHLKSAVLVVNTENGDEILRRDVPYPSAPIAAHPSLQQLACGEGTVTTVIDIPSGSESHRFSRPADSGGASALAWSPDGSRLVTCSEGLTRIITVASAESVTVDPIPGQIYHVAWHQNGRIAVASRNGGIYVVQGNTGQIRRRFRGHQHWVNAIAWSHDGARIASASAVGAPRVWNPDQPPADFDIPTPYWTGSAWAPDSRRIAVPSGRNIEIWDVDERQRTPIRCVGDPQGAAVVTTAWSPDGQHLATLHLDGKVVLFNAESGNVLHILHEKSPERLYVNGTTQQLSWSADGSRLAAVVSGSEARLFDVHSGDLLATQTSGHAATLLSGAIDPSGERFAFGTTLGTEAGRFGEPQTTLFRGNWTPGVTWAPDGNRLAALADNSDLFTIRVFDPDKPEDPVKFRGATRWANVYQFSPDGSRLAAGCDDGSVCIWDVQSRAMVARFDDFSTRCIGVWWSPDGTRLTTASVTQVIVRDVRQGMERVRHPNSITWVAERLRESHSEADLDLLVSLCQQHHLYAAAVEVLGELTETGSLQPSASRHLAGVLRSSAALQRSTGDFEAAHQDEARAAGLLQKLLETNGDDVEAAAEHSLLALQRRDKWQVLRAEGMESEYGTRLIQEADGCFRTVESRHIFDAFHLTVPHFDARFNQLRIEVLPPSTAPDSFLMSDWTPSVIGGASGQPRPLSPEAIHVSDSVLIPEAVPPGRPLAIMRWTGHHFYRHAPRCAVLKLPETVLKRGEELRLRIAFVVLPTGADGQPTRFRLSVCESQRPGQELVSGSMLPLMNLPVRVRAAAGAWLLEDHARLRQLTAGWMSPQNRTQMLLVAAREAGSDRVQSSATMLEAALQTSWQPADHSHDFFNLVFAGPLIDQVLSAGGTPVRLQRLRASLHAQQARVSQAISDFEEVQTRTAFNGRELWLLSLCYRASGEFQKAAQMTRQHLDLSPNDLFVRNRLARTLTIHAQHDANRGALQAALDRMTESIHVGQQALVQVPLSADSEIRGAHAQIRADLNTSLQLKIGLLRQLDRNDEANSCWKQVIDNLNAAVEIEVRSIYRAVNLNALARVLANCPVESLRNPKRAAALSAQAVELADNYSEYLNTLAVAQFRCGNFDEALRCFERSQQAGHGGDAFDWYFRAMLHHRLSDPGQAEFWLRRAVKWHQENAADDEELKRVRREAQQLLKSD